jgi:hypothetical protein
MEFRRVRPKNSEPDGMKLEKPFESQLERENLEAGANGQGKSPPVRATAFPKHRPSATAARNI